MLSRYQFLALAETFGRGTKEKMPNGNNQNGNQNISQKPSSWATLVGIVIFASILLAQSYTYREIGQMGPGSFHSATVQKAVNSGKESLLAQLESGDEFSLDEPNFEQSDGNTPTSYRTIPFRGEPPDTVPKKLTIFIPKQVPRAESDRTWLDEDEFRIGRKLVRGILPGMVLVLLLSLTGVPLKGPKAS